MGADLWLKVVVFVVGAVFGLIVFMQIVYPLFSLVPKVRRLLREEEREKSILLSLLFFSPVVWTTVLLFSILLVIRYFPAYWKAYMLGLGTVLIFVLFFVQRRNEEVEDEMITKVKDRMKLTGSDSSSKPPWET
jgi:cytochrome c biogenesis protein CcdA